MEAIIDSNFLTSPALRAFLGGARRNKAVLTDYSAMEAYKNQDALAAMKAQMEIVSAYSSQVLILKGTAKVAGLRGRKAGLRRRLIDQDQTANFPEFCRQLQQGANDGRVAATIAGHAAEARHQIDRITGDMPELIEGIKEAIGIYDAHELRILRSRDTFTDLMVEKFMHSTLMLAAQLHHRHPNSQRPPNPTEVPNTFLFRVAICMQLLVLGWAETGRSDKRADKLRNDIIDVNFVAFATFFDDFLTNDRMARELYLQTKVALNAIVPSDLMP